MSGTGNPFNDPRRMGSDPASQLFEVASDFWTRGVDAWRSALGAGAMPGGGRSPFGAATGAPDDHDRTGEGLAAWQAATEQFANLAPAMSRAWMIAAGSTGRYWGTIAEVHARYQGAIAQAAVDRSSGQAAASPAECRLLADELRAYLREIGDAALLEARRLQTELEAVGEEIAQATNAASLGGSTPDPRPRRHRVKP